MNPNSKILKLLLIGLLFFPDIGNSQCRDDFFGFWKADDGKFIKLIEYDPIRKIDGETVIGDRSQSFTGVHFYEDKILKIHNYEYSYNEKTKQSSSIKRFFEFKVLMVDKQSMKIRPVSDEMKSLFGLKDVTLFNEYFIPIDSFKLDSLFYTRLHLSYEIEIDKHGNMKLEEDFSYRGKKKKYYSGSLDENKFKGLENLIIKSQIASMSNCELENSCSDCYPIRLKIFHNDKLTYYRVGRLHDNAVPLVRKLNEIITETKWKKIKKKNTAANKG